MDILSEKARTINPPLLTKNNVLLAIFGIIVIGILFKLFGTNGNIHILKYLFPWER